MKTDKKETPKYITVRIPLSVYNGIKALADQEHRTIGNQVKIELDEAARNKLRPTEEYSYVPLKNVPKPL